MMNSVKNHNINPTLRFPYFNDSWSHQQILEITNRISDSINVENDSEYREIGIRSHGKGIFYKIPVKGSDLGNKRVFWVKPDAFIVNIVFAWEQAIAKTTQNEVGMIASHRFPMYLPKENKLDLNFLLYFFLRKKGKYLLELASPGGAGRNKTLGQKNFSELKLPIPIIEEQRKISSLLSFVDIWIRNIEGQKNSLKKYKKGVSQKIFSQKIGFNNEDGSEYPKWNKVKLSDCLDYEQPIKYSVKSKEYNNSYKTPVLTAGKTFILGYTNENDGIFKEGLPVIIFDDFTTSNQFVDFPFKVKSSAMKILKTKSDVNIKYVFEAMQAINYKIGVHGRHWISKYSKININLPSLKEQERISLFLSLIDELITSKDNQLKKAKKWKKGLLQQMFV